MKQFTQIIHIFLLVLLLFAAMTANCLAASELTLSAKAKESTEPYTLADLAVSRLAVYGIFGNGMRTPTKEAHNSFSRIAAVKLLQRAFARNGDASGEIPFEDVGSEDTAAVAWAYANGIANGISATQFGTSDITEREFVTMLLHAMGYRGSFTYADALDFAKAIGLSPAGISQPFTPCDAALYLLAAMKLTAADGAAVHDKLNIVKEPVQTTFPTCIRLTPLTAAEAESQIQEAIRYLPCSIEIMTEHLTQYEAYSLYYSYLRDAFDLEKNYYVQEKWYAPYLDSYSSISPSVRFICGNTEPRITLYVQFNNAWKLACDLDDAFCYFENDTLTNQANSFYQRYVAGTKGEKEIILKAKDAIVKNARYAKAEQIVNGESIYSTASHTLLGFFQNNEIVCDGYAELFQYLMIRAEIPCVTVLGSAQSVGKAYEGSANHAWNKVKLDGAWYNMDVCWADVGSTTIYDLKDNEFYSQHEHWAVTHRNL